MVLTIPALVALRRRFPAARMVGIGYPDAWAVTGSLVDEYLSVDSAACRDLFAADPQADAPLALREADLVIAWTVRPLTLALVQVGHAAGRCLRASPHPSPLPVRGARGTGTGTDSLHNAASQTGVDRVDLPVVRVSPYPPPGVHAAHWLVESLRPLGVDAGIDPKEALTSWRSGFLSVDAPTRNPHLVLLHPGAGAAWKRWPAPSFAALAERLRKQGYDVRLIEGPADAEPVAAVLDALGHSIPVEQPSSLPALGELLAGASRFVGNDSGVTHLAAALGTPTVALFGPTDPASWAPLGAARVLRACTTSPAASREIRVCHDPRCMATLDVDTVLQSIPVS